MGSSDVAGSHHVDQLGPVHIDQAHAPSCPVRSRWLMRPPSNPLAAPSREDYLRIPIRSIKFMESLENPARQG
jgi:hypothetical protein